MGNCMPLEAESVYGAVTQVITLNCEADAAIGELVRVSLTEDEKVEVATDNSLVNPVIGRIRAKPAPTRAEVVLRGVITVDPSPLKGRVYLSPTGGFTASIPTAGYMQELGYSFGNGQVHFQPEQTSILRN